MSTKREIQGLIEHDVWTARRSVNLRGEVECQGCAYPGMGYVNGAWMCPNCDHVFGADVPELDERMIDKKVNAIFALISKTELNINNDYWENNTAALEIIEICRKNKRYERKYIVSKMMSLFNRPCSACGGSKMSYSESGWICLGCNKTNGHESKIYDQLLLNIKIEALINILYESGSVKFKKTEGMIGHAISRICEQCHENDTFDREKISELIVLHFKMMVQRGVTY